MSLRAEISVFDIWRIVIRRKVILLAAWGVILLLAVLVAFFKTPIYRAETVLIIVDDDTQALPVSSLASQFGGLAALGGYRLGSGGIKGEALATLRSRTFLESFIDEYNLLPVFFPDKWNEQTQSWIEDGESDAPTLAKGYEYFTSDVMRVVEDRDGEIVTITIDTPNRELAAEWANALVARLNSRLRERAIEEANKSIEYLNSELEKTGIVELRLAIYHLLEQQIQEVMLANVREEFAFKVIDPAKMPDQDSFVAPKRLLILAIGLIGGLFGGLFVAFLMHSLAMFRAENTVPAD
jgi:uncharacterized protein involved in exopolysaccharide biosynthesis